MWYTEKEIELARRYSTGDCNETQLNYLVSTEKMDRSKVEELIEKMSYGEPMASMAKTVLIMIVFHFLFCIAYSVLQAM